jgi:hypothetical protein
MKFTMDSKLGTLLDDPQAKKIMDQYVPGLSTNPMIAMAKGMTLTMLLAMPQAKQYGITKEKVQSFLDEINKQVK